MKTNRRPLNWALILVTMMMVPLGLFIMTTVTGGLSAEVIDALTRASEALDSP